MKLSEKLSEAQIQRQILDYLTLRGIFAWRNNSGAVKVDGNRFMRFGMPGSADIIGIVPIKAIKHIGPKTFEVSPSRIGEFLAIEVKSVKGKMSPAQESFRDAVRLNGGNYILARSLDDVIEGLK